MAAKVAGPFDRFRTPPAGVDPAWWDQFVDSNNQDYKVKIAENPSSKPVLDAIVQQTSPGAFEAAARKSTPEQIADYGGQFAPQTALGRSSTPQSSARASTVGQINDATTRSIAEDKRLVGGYEGAINRSNMTDNNALGSLTTAQDAARQGYRGVATQRRTDVNAANDLSAQLFGGYAQGQGALNAQDQAGFDRYMTETNPLMQQLTARGSDPADMSRQLGAYNQASGIAGGSLDYSASQYSSNPADIARQQQMFNTLNGIGGGSLDYQADNFESSQADMERQLQGYSDLRNIGMGQLDYKSKAALAHADPESLGEQKLALERIKADWERGGNNQREVMEKFKGLSDPEVTGKERFLSELARREFESSDRGARSAQSEALANRGLRSGGSQLAATQATRQQLSQDRLLKELGIQSQAVDRSMQALGGWGQSANALRSGDQNALNMQAGLTTSMRNASFDEAYKRGVGADTASANNQQVQLAGYQGSAQQSNNIRNANDVVGMFNTGQNNNAYANNQATRLSGYQGAATQSNAIRSANDAVGTFNVGQTNIAKANNQTTRMNGAQLQAAQSNAIRSANDSQRQYEDTFGQNEATRVGNLAGQRAGEGRATTGAISQRQDSVFNGGQRLIQDTDVRNKSVTDTDWSVLDKDYGMSTDYFDAVTGNADRSSNRAGALAGIGTSANAQGTDRLIRSLGTTQNQWMDAEQRQLAGLGF